MTFSLSKKIILKGNESFNKVFKQGKIFSSHYFQIYVIHEGPLKIGFAVQKGYKHKPERNRIKRITRELTRTNYIDYQLSQQMVILTKLDILKTDYITLEKDFNQLLLKIQDYFKGPIQDSNNL